MCDKSNQRPTKGQSKVVLPCPKAVAERAIIRNPSSVRRGGKIGERGERNKGRGERTDEGREGRDRSQIERRKKRKRIGVGRIEN